MRETIITEIERILKGLDLHKLEVVLAFLKKYR